MAETVVGLVGRGRGPEIPLYNRKTVIRITGLTAGSVRVIQNDEHEIVIEANGEYELREECTHARVHSEDGDDSLIALFVRK